MRQEKLRGGAGGTYSAARVSQRTAILVAAAALLVAGCESDDDNGGGRPAARAVSGSVELERPAAGAPDAGTARGHGADVALASTSRRSFSFGGRVDPPDSRVTIVDDRTGRRGAVEVRATGGFTARVTGLRSGLNQFRLEGSKAGLADWTLEVRIVREKRESEARLGRVEVPAVDRTVPQARLRVESAADTIETSSNGPPAHAEGRLGEPLRITAVTRDPDGGAARARVSILERSSCLNTSTAERTTRLNQRYFPPAQIARAKVPPGVVLPRVESRTVRLSFTGERCSGDWIPARSRVTLWADATNAHEMESSSAPVRLLLLGAR